VANRAPRRRMSDTAELRKGRDSTRQRGIFALTCVAIFQPDGGFTRYPAPRFYDSNPSFPQRLTPISQHGRLIQCTKLEMRLILGLTCLPNWPLCVLPMTFDLELRIHNTHGQRIAQIRIPLNQTWLQVRRSISL
jgi:hypothetical protein